MYVSTYLGKLLTILRTSSDVIGRELLNKLDQIDKFYDTLEPGELWSASAFM